MSKKFILIALVAVIAAIGVSQMFKRAGAPPAQRVTTARAGEIEIMPASAFTHTTLTARVVGAMGNDAAAGPFKWYRNGQPIEGAAEPTLDPSLFAKGDEIEVETAATPEGTVRRSQPVVILGSRPQISSGITLQREDRAEVHAQVSVLDVDGDELTLKYAWFRNGEAIPGASGESVDVSGFRNGDRVHAVVTAFDGQLSSAPLACEPVVLGSDAPAITSTPPQSLEGGRYVYQVRTTDHAPGSLGFDLAEAPAGMTIDENGRIEWELPQEQTDVVVHRVAVRVSHQSGGESVQRFTITTGPVTAAAR